MLTSALISFFISAFSIMTGFLIIEKSRIKYKQWLAFFPIVFSFHHLIQSLTALSIWNEDLITVNAVSMPVTLLLTFMGFPFVIYALVMQHFKAHITPFVDGVEIVKTHLFLALFTFCLLVANAQLYVLFIK